MRHTLNRIMGKPQDYKICCGNDEQECWELNWYENEACVYCYTEGNFKENPLEAEIESICHDIADAWEVDSNYPDFSWDEIYVTV